MKDGSLVRRKRRVEVGTKDRGQRVRMYGHGLENVTARVRKREGQKTNWAQFFSSNAIEERRFIVRTTIVAFPTVPLLQQAGILYRRPLRVSKWHTKTVFHIWAKKRGTCTYTHSNWAPTGVHMCSCRFWNMYNHSGRERDTDSYPYHSQRAVASDGAEHLSLRKNCGHIEQILHAVLVSAWILNLETIFRIYGYLFLVNIKKLGFKGHTWLFLWAGTVRIVLFAITKALVKD